MKIGDELELDWDGQSLVIVENILKDQYLDCKLFKTLYQLRRLGVGRNLLLGEENQLILPWYEIKKMIL